MIRDLDDKELRCKGLGQNKVLCSFSGIELPMIKLPLQARRRSLRQSNRSLATRQLLALKTVLTQIPPCYLFFVASSFLPLSCCLTWCTS